jgi:hypothetical protein
VEAAAINERATLDSVRQLASDKAAFGAYLAEQKAAVAGIEQGALKSLDGAARLTAGLLAATLPAAKPTDLERRAAAVVPRPTAKIRDGGYQGWQAALSEAQRAPAAPPAPAQGVAPAATPARAQGIPAGATPAKPTQAPGARGARGVTGEIQLLCDGRNSALDIKKMLDTQFRQETDLEAVLAHLETLKKAGLVAYGK